VVEHLPSMWKALGLIPSIQTNKQTNVNEVTVEFCILVLYLVRALVNPFAQSIAV
jgi:hypothetical protein